MRYWRLGGQGMATLQQKMESMWLYPAEQLLPVAELPGQRSLIA